MMKKVFGLIIGCCIISEVPATPPLEFDSPLLYASSTPESSESSADERLTPRGAGTNFYRAIKPQREELNTVFQNKNFMNNPGALRLLEKHANRVEKLQNDYGRLQRGMEAGEDDVAEAELEALERKVNGDIEGFDPRRLTEAVARYKEAKRAFYDADRHLRTYRNLLPSDGQSIQSIDSLYYPLARDEHVRNTLGLPNHNSSLGEPEGFGAHSDLERRNNGAVRQDLHTQGLFDKYGYYTGPTGFFGRRAKALEGNAARRIQRSWRTRRASSSPRVQGSSALSKGVKVQERVLKHR
jgi:hypothetical protein